MTQDKHIVVITPGFPKDESDTSCIPALQLFVKALSEVTEYQIRVLSLHYPDRKEAYHWHQIAVQPLGWHNQKLRRILGWRGVNQILQRWHKEAPIAVIHSFWLGEAALLAHRFSQKHSIKHICTLMGQDARPGNRYFKILPLRQMRLIALSENHQKILLSSTGFSAPIIPWGLPVTPSELPPERSIDILGVGSLIPLKRWDDFIRVCAGLLEQFPNLKATLIGEGPERASLEALSTSLGLHDILEFTGALSHEQTQERMTQAKILLHPSEYESFGMVFIEAQQKGLAIVSLDVGLARRSEHWAIEQSVEGLTKACAEFLQTDVQATPQHHSISQTVAAYQQQYES